MKRLVPALLLLLVVQAVAAQSPVTPPANYGALESLRARATTLKPEQVVDDFHQHLAEGWKEGALLHLSPELVLFEQGYAERSREAYASGQLESDMVFAASTQREILQRDGGSYAGRAWVTTQAGVRGRVGGQSIDLQSTETMLLRHIEGRWQITHIHWSAHPVER